MSGTRAATGEVPEIAPDGIHAGTLTNVHARLLVQEGGPDRALALVAAPASDPMVERSRCVTLADAHAARGDFIGMYDCLKWLRTRHGRKALERIVLPDGPASEYAREMLAGAGSPCRR